MTTTETAAQADDWQPIETEPADGSDIWISDGEIVWLGVAHKDGSLKLPNRSRCKFWMKAELPKRPRWRPWFPPSNANG